MIGYESTSINSDRMNIGKFDNESHLPEPVLLHVTI